MSHGGSLGGLRTPIVCAVVLVLGCWLAPVAAQAEAGAAVPALVGTVHDSNSLSGATSVAIASHYAYTTAYWAGRLTAVDISNPTHPTIAGFSNSTTDMIGASTVNIAGGYAFVASKNLNASMSSNDNGQGDSFTILDIHTNPAVPAIVGSIRDTTDLFGAYGVAVQGHYAYVAAQGTLSGQPTAPDPGNGAFTVIDFSDPTHPAIADTILNPPSGQFMNALHHADAVAVSGHDAYVTSSYTDALTVIDISNPLSPQIVKKLQDHTRLFEADDVAVQGNYAYVADETAPGGFTIVNIANPANPQIVGFLTSSFFDNAYRIRLRGNFAYMSSDAANTISMIDISNPVNPRLVAEVLDPVNLRDTTGLDIALTGRYLVGSSPATIPGTSPLYPPFPLQGGPTDTGAVSVIDLDPSPVAVSVTSPANGTSYREGQVVHAAYSCTPQGLFGLTSCSGPVRDGAKIPTGAPGRHSFRVTGADAGGQSGAATVLYTVVGPTVTHLRQSAPVWREHGKAARGKPPVGTTFRFKLSFGASVTLSFLRPGAGRLLGGACVRATKHNAHAPACALTVGTLTVHGHAGRNRVRFAGRLRGRLLPAGNYTLEVPSGSGAVVRLMAFTIAR